MADTKDAAEIGWMFVQQYYTMMNKTPKKLHLFYNKSSHYVHGTEGESVKVVQGQQEIHAQIADLDLKDCKVLVSNVDSQSTLGGGIIIQVLGEMSNDGQEARKFAQTFCLAPQDSGFYVYNDIFRFLKEEVDSEFDDEQPQQSAAAARYEQPSSTQTPSAAATNGSSDAAAAFSRDVSSAPAVSATTSTVNGVQQPEMSAPAKQDVVVEKTATPAPTPAPAAAAAEPVAVATPGKSEAVESVAEKPVQEPQSIAAAAAAATETKAAEPAEPAAPAAPVKPAAPLSWAARAAASAAQKVTAAATATAQTVTGVPRTAPQSTPAAQSAPKPAATPVNVAENDRKLVSPVASGGSVPSAEIQAKSAFLKNVTREMSDEDVRSALRKFGAYKTVELNRAKGCGFVDYLDAGSCAAAIAQGRIEVAGDMLNVEERRKDNPNKPYLGKQHRAAMAAGGGEQRGDGNRMRSQNGAPRTGGQTMPSMRQGKGQRQQGAQEARAQGAVK